MTRFLRMVVALFILGLTILFLYMAFTEPQYDIDSSPFKEEGP